MTAIVFTPLLTGSRVVLGIVAGLLVGPLVAFAIGRRAKEPSEFDSGLELPAPNDTTWRQALSEGLGDWAAISARYAIRLGPLMVAAAFATGLVLQWVNPGDRAFAARRQRSRRGRGRDDWHSHQRSAHV